MDAGENKPSFAITLRGERERAKLTQEQLAQKTGVSVRTIARLESGESEPSYDTHQKMLELFPAMRGL